MNKLTDRIADAGALTCTGGFVFGATIQSVNALLQAGAFIVAMISGICAAIYYVKNARRP